MRSRWRLRSIVEWAGVIEDDNASVRRRYRV